MTVLVVFIDNAPFAYFVTLKNLVISDFTDTDFIGYAGLFNTINDVGYNSLLENLDITQVQDTYQLVGF